MLGQPVVRALLAKGHAVRILARSAPAVQNLFGGSVEICPGSAGERDDIETALAGCDAVHINLPQEVELPAVQHLLDLAGSRLQRLSYVSATSAFAANRWFPLVESKLRVEERLQQSGIPHVVFCPTWAMETLPNFYHDRQGAIIIGKNPPPLHFLAGADFGRIVAAAYEDNRALGKRLFLHGPEAVTLPVALERYFAACHPGIKVTRMPLWQARLIAKLTKRQALRGIVELIEYFDQVGEPGDPTETNQLFGAPAITLDQWFAAQAQTAGGLPH